ncbi:MAG: NAD(P)H-dependent oxidoreductase [Hyphomicrobiales bacterium]|nr:NAD(P)H-dependent oxidoreductase [Hyphomicrobiales bacterium]
MADLNVITICGSLRKASFNAALLRALPSLAPAGMNITAAPSWADIPIYNADVQSAGFPAPVTAWAEAVRAADGVVIVSPEYNWTIPGGLKNALDWTSRMKDDPFKGKPVALQSCAGGLLGGARMQYHLRQCLTSLESAVLIRPEVYVNFAAKKFAEGTLELTDPAIKDMVKLQLEAFRDFVRKHTGKS